jgi:tellurite resistance protein TehA-like permease
VVWGLRTFLAASSSHAASVFLFSVRAYLLFQYSVYVRSFLTFSRAVQIFHTPQMSISVINGSWTLPEEEEEKEEEEEQLCSVV